MHEHYPTNEPLSDEFKHSLRVQEKLDDITEEVRKKFVETHQTTANSFDDEDIMKGVSRTLQFDINACKDPDDLKVLLDAYERSKDITLINIRQSFEMDSRSSHDRRRRG